MTDKNIKIMPVNKTNWNDFETLLIKRRTKLLLVHGMASD